MSEPTTEAGKRLAGATPALSDFIAAIEAEAREGYVPAALSPEWHAELTYAADEAVNAALDKVAALVEAAKERDALIVRIEPVDYIAYEAAAERYRNALAAIEAARPKP